MKTNSTIQSNLWQDLSESQQEFFKGGMLKKQDKSLSPGGGGVNEIRFNNGDPDRPIIIR